MTCKCPDHDYQTESLTEWSKHTEEFKHDHSGVAPCNLCGIKTDFEYFGKVKPGKIPALCKECKESF